MQIIWFVYLSVYVRVLVPAWKSQFITDPDKIEPSHILGQVRIYIIVYIGESKDWSRGHRYWAVSVTGIYINISSLSLIRYGKIIF